MKLFSVLFATSCLCASAFGVTHNNAVKKSAFAAPPSVQKPAFKKDSASTSPLFRDPSLVRAGAVPGWAAYNNYLDTNPLMAKSLTSLVGWALGDLLAQVWPTLPSLV